MSCALSVMSPSTKVGKRNITSEKMTVMPPASIKPMPIVRLMLSRSPLPQNWLKRTLEPLCKPNTISCMMKTGTFATVTALICTLPSRPTIKVSRKPSEVVIKFWMMTGSASVNSQR